MAGYLVRRLLLSALTLLMITLFVYAAARVLPGEPTWGEEPQMRPHVDAWLRSVHATESIPLGYARWLGGMARLDLGTSIALQPGRRVSELVREALPWTLTLGLLSFLTTLLIALPLGTIAAWRPASLAARTGTAGLYLLHALPTFWIALVLQDLLAARMGLLPVLATSAGGPGAGAASPSSWILPTLALSIGSLAFVIRFFRSTLLDCAQASYARAARARGAGDARILMRHALANTVVPMVTLLGMILPGILGGSVVIESIFALPGLGRLLFRAAAQRDYPVVMGLALLTAAATLAATLIADLLYRVADPRVPRAGDREADA